MKTKINLHPIHYSLLLNLVILAFAGALSWKMEQPLVFVVALLLANHSLGRFSPDEKEPGNYEGSSGMGFGLPDPELDDDAEQDRARRKRK